MRPLISDLQQMAQALPGAATAQASNGNGAGADAAGEDEDVIDAEFTRE